MRFLAKTIQFRKVLRMKFYVLPYTFARQHIPQEPTLAIRIFDPSCQSAEGNNSRQTLQASQCWIKELHYTFADYDPYRYIGFSLDVQEGIQKEYQNTAINPRIAEMILRDFVAHEGKISAVMIHCNAGLSRSPAVALALCHRFNLQPEWVGVRDYYMKTAVENMAAGETAPNTLVYAMLMEAII